MSQTYTLINETDNPTPLNSFYIYELCDPVTLAPFYVGKGKGRRAITHISMRNAPSFTKSNPHKCNTINKILSQGHTVIIRIVACYETEPDAFIHEQELVSKYGRRCNQTGILTNLTRGGDGQTQDGKPVDQYTMWGEFIKTWPNAYEATRWYGWKCYSAINKCCNNRETSYKKFLWCYAGSAPTMLTKIKPIYQWTLTDELVKVHYSITSAAAEVGCNPTNLNNCVHGRTKTAKGYKWTFGPTVS